MNYIKASSRRAHQIFQLMTLVLKVEVKGEGRVGESSGSGGESEDVWAGQLWVM